MNKKICGLTLPDEINDYIRKIAKEEHRSLANVISMIVIDFYNNKEKRSYHGM